MLKKLISGERKKAKKVDENQHEEFRSQGSDSDTFSNQSVSDNKVKKYRRRKSNLQKLEESENMMSSVSSMGSSVRKLRMNESGITVTSDFSNMTFKESLGE